ncbi:immunoglobulin superfamily member 1-like [Mauremys mutica]|uniref:immunoglobulin superfamily member 1-like n=1 Tax=Mauremys mutica TaxID=74926 RepID=UPI001D16B4E0|nr:immunoglobulin superfamily member 1-like [Mauremys mutica]
MGPPPALLLALGVIWTRLPLAAARKLPAETSVVQEYPLSKPSISLSPSGEIAPGTDVTISCHGPQQGVRFKMYRAGVVRWHMEPAGSTAEFHIPNARREDGGSYTCSYETLREPPVSSPHSDPLQLVVEAHYPKPSISLSPSGEIAPGTDVTVSCQGPRQGVRFKLYRAGVAQRHTEPAGSTAEFRIPNARRENGGSYTCSYESLREPPVISPHSDPVQLVVADAGSGPAGRTDPTQPGAAPAPTRPGSTLPGAPPRQDYPPFAIVRLSLAAGVLLLLVFILAEAAYSWRRTPHLLTPPRPGGERGRQPEGQTEAPAWELQPPQIPARSLGTEIAGHTHVRGRGAVIGPAGPSISI